MKEQDKKRIVWFCRDIILAAALIALDQWTKALAVAKLKGGEAFVILRGVFELEYLENRGSAFGMFQGKKIFLLIVGVVFMAFLCYFLYKAPTEKRFVPLRLLAAFIMAGGIGNMIDRFVLGYVVDFFSFVLIHFPVFNVADIYITVSTILLAILLIFVYKEEELTFLWKTKRSKAEDDKSGE
ncbi:MAG: signal peptidase II [Lachnospiraceae bacterium]|nr:signal peptidase II [Lachnospiraceae bacterium]